LRVDLRDAVLWDADREAFPAEKFEGSRLDDALPENKELARKASDLVVEIAVREFQLEADRIALVVPVTAAGAYLAIPRDIDGDLLFERGLCWRRDLRVSERWHAKGS
jgi:hypothetical protein